MKGLTWQSLLAGIIGVLLVVGVSALIILPAAGFDFRKYVGLQPITGTPGTENPFSGITPNIGGSCMTVMGGCGDAGNYLWNTSTAGDAKCDSSNDVGVVKCPSGYYIMGGGCRNDNGDDVGNIAHIQPTNKWDIYDASTDAEKNYNILNSNRSYYDWWLCDWDQLGGYEIAYATCCQPLSDFVCTTVLGGCIDPNGGGDKIGQSRSDISAVCNSGNDVAAVKCPRDWKVYGGGCDGRSGAHWQYMCPTNNATTPAGNDNGCGDWGNSTWDPVNGYSWFFCNSDTSTNWETAYAICCGQQPTLATAISETCNNEVKPLIASNGWTWQSDPGRVILARTPVWDYDANGDGMVDVFTKDGVSPTSFGEDNLEELCGKKGCKVGLVSDAEWQAWWSCCITNVCGV